MGGEQSTALESSGPAAATAPGLSQELQPVQSDVASQFVRGLLVAPRGSDEIIISTRDGISTHIPVIPTSGWEFARDPSTNRVFFINHSTQTTTWDHPGNGQQYLLGPGKPGLDGLGPRDPPVPQAHALVGLPHGWDARVDRQGRLYFVDLRLRQSTWTHPQADRQGRVPCQITHAPIYHRSFHDKLIQFRIDVTPAGGETVLNIRREFATQDTMREVQRMHARGLRRRFRIIFDGEEGLDYGGPSREWLSLLAMQLFSPNAGMFVYTDDDGYLLDVSPGVPGTVEDWKHTCYFTGQMLGIAARLHYQIPVVFSELFVLRLLRREPNKAAFEGSYPGIARNLAWLQQNTIDESLGLTFTVDYHVSGALKTVDLLPNGSHIVVVEANKRQYIRLLRKWYCSGPRTAPSLQFALGFASVVPPDTLSSFSGPELVLLLCGLEHLSVADWREHTMYIRGFTPESPLVQWFWEVLEECSPDDQRAVLKFVTGSARVPLEGFSGLLGTTDRSRPFTLGRGTDPNRLPVAHTCFNRLTIPPVSSKARLREVLLMAAHNTEGFGIQ